MCKDFECKSEHYGTCGRSGEECEMEKCVYWSDCAECESGNICFPSHGDDN